MAKSRDWDELVYVWSEWRRKSGENMKDMYEQLVELTNEAANYNSTYLYEYLRVIQLNTWLTIDSENKFIYTIIYSNSNG